MVPKGSTSVPVGRRERGLQLQPESRGAILQQLPMIFGRCPACGGPVGLQAAGGHGTLRFRQPVFMVTW